MKLIRLKRHSNKTGAAIPFAGMAVFIGGYYESASFQPIAGLQPVYISR